MTSERLPAEIPPQTLVFDPAAPSPLVARGLERLARRDGSTTAVGARILWSLSDRDLRLPWVEGATGDLLVVGSGHWNSEQAHYGVDFATGAIRWIHSVDACTTSSLLLGGNVLLFARDENLKTGEPCSEGCRLIGIDLRTGTIAWVREGDDLAGIGAVNATEELLFAHRDDFLTAVDPATGQLRWRAAVEGPPEVSVRGILAFVGDKQGLCARVATTGDAVWRYRYGGPISVWASDRDVLLAMDHDGKTLVGLDAGDGTEIWRFQDVDGKYYTCGLVGGAVLISTPGALFAMDARTFALRWRLPTDYPAWISVVPWKEDLLAILTLRAGAAVPWLRLVEPDSGHTVWATPEDFVAPMAGLDRIALEPHSGWAASIAPDGVVRGTIVGSDLPIWRYDPSRESGSEPIRDSLRKVRFFQVDPVPWPRGVSGVSHTRVRPGSEILIQAGQNATLLEARTGNLRCSVPWHPSMAKSAKQDGEGPESPLQATLLRAYYHQGCYALIGASSLTCFQPV